MFGKAVVNGGYFMGEGGQLILADIFLEHHDIIEVELFFAVDFDLAEIGVTDKLVEGVFLLES